MVKIGAHCSYCGGSLGINHGTPVVVSPADTPVWVSISRVPGLVVASASLAGRVGVDIESITRMSRAPVDAVALHPRELREIAGLRELATLTPAGLDRATTLHWTRKEALLKATGHGLRIPPASIDLSGIGGGQVVLRDAPGEVSGLLSTLGARAVFATLRVAELLSGGADAGSVDADSTDACRADADSADADIVGNTCVLERP
ncbi:MAG: hypothetical protein JWQ43_3287 [Glaciihabitans sp.]|nr:hypothetical protein [Glaciihabitans sp.]